MSLLSLSNELLFEIASHLEYDSDINALMRTSGRLYYPLSTYLYRRNIRHSESSAIEWAIRNGVVSVVQRMLDEGVPEDHYFEYPGLKLPGLEHPELEYPEIKWRCIELIELAIRHRNESLVKLLLERGVDPDPTGWVYSKKKERRKAIALEYGEGQDSTPLNCALSRSSASVVRLLVSHAKTLRGEQALTGPQEHLWGEVPPGFEGLGFPQDASLITLMMNACREGDPTVVEFLTKNMAKALDEMEDDYENYCIPLIEAVKRNDLELIRVLLNAGYDPNYYSDRSDGEVPLHFAIKDDNIETVRLLLDNGARPDFAYKVNNDNSLELLNQAARWGNAAISKLLLQYIDVESKITDCHKERDTIINTAAAFGFMDIFQMILKKNKASKGDIFSLHNKYLRPPLSFAAENGHMDIVALLLDDGSDVHAGGWSTESYTPLIMAVSNDHTEIVKLLLDRGIDFSREGLYGIYEALPRDKISLGTAALCHSTKFPALFRLLLDAVGTRSNPEESFILMIEVISCGNVELLQLLVNRGLRLDLSERHNVNLVKYAAKGGAEMLNALSNYGVMVVSPEDIDAQYSLCMAVYEGNSAVVDYFLRQGFDPNYIHPSFSGHSYMELATRAKSLEAAAATLDALVHHGANMDDLPGACTYRCDCVQDDEQQLRAARLLLERGASPSPCSAWGRTTLGIALSRGRRKTSHLMLQEICNRGIFFDNLDNVMRWIEEQVRSIEQQLRIERQFGIEQQMAIEQQSAIEQRVKYDSRLSRIIENFYWRQRYPVPDTAKTGLSDAMGTLVI